MRCVRCVWCVRYEGAYLHFGYNPSLEQVWLVGTIYIITTTLCGGRKGVREEGGSEGGRRERVREEGGSGERRREGGRE